MHDTAEKNTDDAGSVLCIDNPSSSRHRPTCLVSRDTQEQMNNKKRVRDEYKAEARKNYACYHQQPPVNMNVNKNPVIPLHKRSHYDETAKLIPHDIRVRSCKTLANTAEESRPSIKNRLCTTCSVSLHPCYSNTSHLYARAFVLQKLLQSTTNLFPARERKNTCKRDMYEIRRRIRKKNQTCLSVDTHNASGSVMQKRKFDDYLEDIRQHGELQAQNIASENRYLSRIKQGLPAPHTFIDACSLRSTENVDAFILENAHNPDAFTMQSAMNDAVDVFTSSEFHILPYRYEEVCF
jgi:hypothetical protein